MQIPVLYNHTIIVNNNVDLTCFLIYPFLLIIILKKNKITYYCNIKMSIQKQNKIDTTSSQLNSLKYQFQYQTCTNNGNTYKIREEQTESSEWTSSTNDEDDKTQQKTRFRRDRNLRGDLQVVLDGKTVTTFRSNQKGVNKTQPRKFSDQESYAMGTQVQGPKYSEIPQPRFLNF